MPEILLPRILADRRHDSWGRAANSAVMDAKAFILHPTLSWKMGTLPTRLLTVNLSDSQSQAANT